MPDQRLIVVSNRLPFVFSRNPDGEPIVQPGSGGLVTALVPILRQRGGVWVGWPGTADIAPECGAMLDALADEAGYRLTTVALTSDQVDRFYLGFSNEVIWPLFHDLQSFCRFDPSYWDVYREVNSRYAEVVAANAAEGDLIWVHDYQLMNVAAELRARGLGNRLAFFLHIPFPPLDIFAKLPWRSELLRSLLEYDLLGFQTPRDRRNFLQCLRWFFRDVEVSGSGSLRHIVIGERSLTVGSFPISIDYDDFVTRASTTIVDRRVAALRAMLPDRQLVLGVDRLDYTKGIPEKLFAFRAALERYPDLHEKVTLIQVVVPSREDIPRYHELKQQIEGLVGEINGRFTRPGGWVPIHYIFRSIDGNDLLAYYRVASVGLVTPLKDGMNLVAKEYCACSLAEDSVLVLSEFAGAAAQLQHGAILVNPHDVAGTAAGIHEALTMDPDERRDRMRRLRHSIRRQDVYRWVTDFLQTLLQKNAGDPPAPDEYAPIEDLGPTQSLRMEHPSMTSATSTTTGS